MVLRHKLQLISGIVLLIGGGLIYISYRKETLAMFSWFRKVNFDYHSIRNNINSPISDFAMFSLPDGLWLLAYQLIIAAVWKNRISKASAACIYSMPAVILIEEALQGLGIVRGTFDICDVICYLLATMIATAVILLVK